MVRSASGSRSYGTKNTEMTLTQLSGEPRERVFPCSDEASFVLVWCGPGA